MTDTPQAPPSPDSLNNPTTLPADSFPTTPAPDTPASTLAPDAIDEAIRSGREEGSGNVLRERQQQPASIGKYARDAALAVPAGIGEFGNSTADLSNHLFGTEFDTDGKDVQPISLLGGITSGAVDFGVGYLTGSALLGTAAKLTRIKALVGTAEALTAGKTAEEGAAALYDAHKLTKTGETIKAFAAGGFADFVGRSGDKGRLADFLPHNPLSTDPEDSFYSGRFKNMAEGAGIGLAFHALGSMAKAAFHAGQGKDALALKSFDEAVKFAQTHEKLKAAASEAVRITAGSDVPITAPQADAAHAFLSYLAVNELHLTTPAKLESFLAKYGGVRETMDGRLPIEGRALVETKTADGTVQASTVEGGSGGGLAQAEPQQPIIPDTAPRPPVDVNAELTGGTVQDRYANVSGVDPTADLNPITAEAMKNAPPEVRGFIQFAADHAMVYLHASADPSTYVHELGHFVRRFGLAPDSLTALERSFGSFDEKKVGPEAAAASEEKFAEAFERYFIHGKSPSGDPSVVAAMKSVQDGVISAYKGFNIPGVAADVSPENLRLMNQVMGFGEGARVAGPAAPAVDAALAQKRKTAFNAELSAKLSEAVSASPRESVLSTLDDTLDTTFNHTRADLASEEHDILKITQDTLDKYVFDRRGGKMTNEMTAALADELVNVHGTSPETALKFLKNQDRAAVELNVKALAGRQMLNKFVRSVQDASVSASADPGNAVLQKQLLTHVGNLQEAFTLANNSQTEYARGLQSYNISTTSSEFTGMEKAIREVQKSIKGNGIIDQQKIIRALAMSEDSSALRRLLDWVGKTKDASASRLLSVHNEWWINALLGAAKTHITNFVSQFGQTILLPASRIAGGAFSLNPEAMQSGARAYMNLVSATFDIFDLTKTGLRVNPDSSAGQAWKAFINEEPILTKLTKVELPRHAITAENLGVTNPVLAHAVDWTGNAVRLPTRMLTGMDELFKQINYRAWLRDAAYREAMGRGLRPDSAEFSAVVKEFIEDGFDKVTGAGTHDPSLLMAKRATFTQELVEGSILQKYSSMVQDHPILRTITPFIRVPVNLVKTVRDYTPGLNYMFKEFRDEVHNPDPMISADAKGRAAIGSLFWTVATVAATNGKVTGGGPKDPKQRDILMSQGWRPYSVVTTDPTNGKKSYYDYRRLEPASMLFGLAADYADISAHVEDEGRAGAATAMVMAVAKNLSSKTYLKGLSDALEVMTMQDEGKVQSILQSRVGSYVPNYVPMMNSDITMREVRGYIDHLKQRVPGYSDTLPPKRDLFGQPVLAPPGYAFDTFRHSTEIGDPVKDELAKLDYGFSPPSKKMRGVDLTSIFNAQGRQAYDRFEELHGEVRLGGKSLPEALSSLIRSRYYKSLPEPDGTGSENASNGRVKEVQNVISRYREVASEKMLREFPQVKQMQQQIQQQKLQAQRPVSPTMGKLQALAQ